MKIYKTRMVEIVVMVACMASALPVAAGGKQDIARAAVARALERDAARDAATVARPLAESKKVWRYTTETQARQEAKQGIEAGRHFTPNVTRGRPPNAATAREQYGLPADPDVRMTVRLEEGRAMKSNKAINGQRGRGEITNAEPLPPEAILNIRRVPNGN